MYILVLDITLDEQAEKIMSSKKQWWRDYSAKKLLWFGISCIGCAFYFFAPVLFTTEKSLIAKQGEVENVNAYYAIVSSKGHKSVKSELLLNLRNDTRNYKLARNIEQSWHNEKYELIERELNKSGRAIVWIKESEQSEIEPKIFQIATGENKILYDMDDAKSDSKFLFPFLLILGFFGIGVYLNHKYSSRITRLMRKKPAHNTIT